MFNLFEALYVLLINVNFPIDVMLEQGCIKFIWTLLHSSNIIEKSVMRSAIRNGYSTLGEHFRYPIYKYNLSPTYYVTDFIVTPDISHFIRELCVCRDYGDCSVLTSTEMSKVLEYICTI